LPRIASKCALTSPTSGMSLETMLAIARDTASSLSLIGF